MRFSCILYFLAIVASICHAAAVPSDTQNEVQPSDTGKAAVRVVDAAGINQHVQNTRNDGTDLSLRISPAARSDCERTHSCSP
ncbi:hypothetical protein EUX98_g6293 [Antrodiella citrinella]|uniref:Pectate lyase n=1 Tax=Antrodiella citrinella TaxID=2447956 RepID=A0A4S4MPN0_9APHY|nr:hypothetical protein EUX98_g6293 [Antrodiella citrinella]